MSNPSPSAREFADAAHAANETMRDMFTYPPAGQGAVGYDGGAGLAGAGSATSRLAEETLRQALGWRYRSGDVRGFNAALDRSFTLKEDEEGRVTARWTPQTYAVQADLGEITGAQASVLEQARVTIDYILPLVEGLKPLRVDSDPEDIRAVTVLLAAKFNAIKADLARVGGPRVQKIDLIYQELLGFPIDVPISDHDAWREEVEKTDGGKTRYSLLHQLTEELGLEPALANTVEEERNLTNALIVIDSVIALRTAWIGKRPYFDRSDTNKDRYLGTQLVWISRQLDVVAESVRDAYQAMDSVYFGPQEREATDISYVKQGTKEAVAPITVADLLDWVHSFATVDASHLLHDAGKDGVLALRSTVARLQELVGAAREYSERGAGTGAVPRSFFNARVERALGEIEQQLLQVSERAERITRTARPAVGQGKPINDLDAPEEVDVDSVGAGIISSDTDSKENQPLQEGEERAEQHREMLALLKKHPRAVRRLLRRLGLFLGSPRQP